MNWVPILVTFLAYAKATSIDSVASCQSDEKIVFLMEHNTTVGKTLRILPRVTFTDCSDHCSSSSDCHGIIHSHEECKIFGEGLEKAPEGVKILKKACIKTDHVCSSPFHFDAFDQKILVGFAREVVPADNIQICMAACLNSFDTFGFECESAMFYPIDRECILNTEDRLGRPDLFTDEVDDTVIYIDNNCAGSQCYAPYITQYIAVEGKQLENELDRIINVDLDSCQSLCTQRLSISANDFNCKSFMYNNQSRTCILSDERSFPMGRGNLIPTPGYTYYEKKCFASPTTCRNVPSFTRISQKILVGFADFIMENVPSVTMCLDQCTNPPPETGDDFVCKSVMYYYNEQECILNAETRHSKPDLFISEGDEFLVDYFDISCHLEAEKCSSGSHLKAVRTINAALPEGESELHVLKSTGNSVQDCMKKCFNLSPDKCRSFNFDKKSGKCDLLYLDGKTGLRPQVRQGTDFYDLHCLADLTLVEGECSTKKDDALFSRYLYTKQHGVPTKTYKVVSVDSCLEVCAGNPNCAGVNYNRRLGQCDVFNSINEDSDANEYIDFYKNLCVVKEDDTTVSAAANVPPPNYRISGTVTGKDHGSAVSSNKKVKPNIRPHDRRLSPEHSVPTGPPVHIPPEAIKTLCNYEGMKIQINNEEIFSGIIFVKNKFDSCRVEITNSNSAILNLGLPKDFGMKIINLEEEEDKSEKKEEDFKRIKRQMEGLDCGIVDLLNGTYKTTVVVQTNNLGIPGLVTSMDQLYEVSCDYSSMLGGKVQAGKNITVNGPEPSLIQPRGKIELGNPVFMQVLGEGAQPIAQANIGDILELRWEIMAMDDELDFFIRKCHAERGVGTKNEKEKEKLQLIEEGCPTPAVSKKLIPGPIEVESTKVKIARMQAFRFDSSSMVRITCELEVCKGDCAPVECPLATGPQQKSWGRKKREINNTITEYETSLYKIPRFSQSTTSLVILDPLQTVQEPISMAQTSFLEMDQIENYTFAIQLSGHTCMRKMVLYGIFGVLLSFIFIQSFVVFRCFLRR